MSDCLHCAINELVREHVEGGNNDLVEIASMMAESVADLVLLAPEEDRANLLAHVVSAAGRWSWKRAAQSRAAPTQRIEHKGQNACVCAVGLMPRSLKLLRHTDDWLLLGLG